MGHSRMESKHVCAAAGMSVPTSTTLKHTHRPELGIAGRWVFPCDIIPTPIVRFRFLAILDAGNLSAGPLAEAVIEMRVYLSESCTRSDDARCSCQAMYPTLFTESGFPAT